MGDSGAETNIEPAVNSSKDSNPLQPRGEFIDESLNQKQRVEEIKVQWRHLWQERVDDKVRAEGIASDDYSKLFVEKGTIIHATRNFKALNFREILEQNEVQNTERFVPPSPHIGGWTKFIKATMFIGKPERHKRASAYVAPEKEKQQPKKGGRGWLHK